MADSYPFRFRLERTFRSVNKRGDSETALTKPRRAQIAAIRGLDARIRFLDIVSGIVLHEHVRAVTTYRSGNFFGRVETQRLLEVSFKRPPP